MSFEKLFIESKGRPIQYNGREIFMADIVQIDGKEVRFRLVFEKTNSTWRQGVGLKVKGGHFDINLQEIKIGTVLWYDTAPEIVEFTVVSKGEPLWIYNIWDVGNGTIHSGHNGAAMYSENIPNGKRYYCNDGYPDDDFDDLIFTLERL